MPAIFTHIQFGKEVAATLPPALLKLTEEHPQAFFAGTQGPDILFYHKPLKSKSKNPARKKGWDLHAEAPERFFLNAARRIVEKDEEVIKAYALGFLCHFTLDSHCHPYIDESSVNGVTHGKIESEFDKLQFRKLGQKERGFNAATLFSPSDEAEYAVAKVLEVSAKNAKTALRSMRKINALFSHKSGFVHSFCHAALTLVGQNKSFGEMFLHKKEDTRCIHVCKRLDELFKEALPIATAQITDFFENLTRYVAENGFQQEFYRRNYSGKLTEEEA